MNKPMPSEKSLTLDDFGPDIIPGEAESLYAQKRAHAIVEHLVSLGYEIQLVADKSPGVSAEALISSHLVEPPDSLSFGQRMKIARKRKGVTQAELADRLGIRQPSVVDMEKGDNMGEQTLRKVAAALEMTLLELLNSGR